MTEARMRKLQEVQDRTYREMEQALATYGLCNVVRPTGFGKTEMFVRYAREHPERKMLYVYDTSALYAVIQATYDCSAIDFISYRQLSRVVLFDQNIEDILGGGYGVVAFDESHLMGGTNIQKLLEVVVPELLKQSCFVVGGTATPLRTDMVNVTARFFDNHTISLYDLQDAFNDGLMERPLFTVMLYTEKKIQRALNTYCNNPYAVKRLKQLELACAKRTGAPKVYREAVTKLYGEVPDYMKFIAFYPTIATMKENSLELVRDFEKAFPGYTIDVCAVSSAPEHFSGISQLNTDKGLSKHIDLITCVDMLNQGYHSTTLTGIIMNRATLSNIVYTQQLGRCLSVMAERPAHVFDNVGNCDYGADECIAATQTILADAYRGGPTGIPRDYRRVEVMVNAEEREVAEWYERIRATADLTQEDIDVAKRLYTKFSAPTSYIEKEYKVPEWLLKEELGDAVLR